MLPITEWILYFFDRMENSFLDLIGIFGSYFFLKRPPVRETSGKQMMPQFYLFALIKNCPTLLRLYSGLPDTLN